MTSIGALSWAIAEGYIPEESTGPAPEMTSHETACILNCNPQPAKIDITVFFADRAPLGPYRLEVPAERTHHLRFSELGEGGIPHGTDFACVLKSDIPVVVQHTRLDSRQAENALMTTVAYSG